jgi:hypothetical protein
MSLISDFGSAVQSYFDRTSTATDAIAADLAVLKAKVLELQNSTSTSEQDQAALDAIQARITGITLKLEALDALTPPVVVTPPGGDETDAQIKAEVEDYTLSGINKRFGPTAPEGMVIPDVWERPVVPGKDLGYNDYIAPKGPYSEGLETSTVPPEPPAARIRFDYGSDDLQVGFLSKVPFEPTTPPKGYEVGRLRVSDHSGGSVMMAPVKGYNYQSSTPGIGDRDGVAHVIYNMKEDLGPIIQIASGKVNRYDCRPGLYGRKGRGKGGFWGMFGTQTAFPSWAGADLLPEMIPLCITVSPQNEFVYIGCHNEKTNKGCVAVFWLGSGNDLLSKQNKGFPFDWKVCYPGLINSGMIAMTKLFGYFDLPIKWPTNIDINCTAGANTRIQGKDGNAAYLSAWDLSTAEERALFLKQNPGWIPTWGKACVTSKYEDKMVMLDFTALYAGVREQYFSTPEKFAEVAYQHPGSAYGSYDLKDPMVWPWGKEAKPEWAPVVTNVIDIPTPNFMLMHLRDDCTIGIVSPDGNWRCYNWSDGSLISTKYVGVNPVHMNHDKGAAGADARRANSGPIITCRGDRSITGFDSWGSNAKAIYKIQDPILKDPVAAEAQDMHGIETRLIVVADLNGEQVVSYRASPLKFATQGGKVVPIGPDGVNPPPSFERLGEYALDGNPYTVSGSNIN